MVFLFSSLFLLLFHSFVQAEISSNCAQHACLRIHGCLKSTGANAIWYFKMVSDSTVKWCTKAYVTIVFEQSARDIWSIDVATNVSDKTLRYGPDLMRDFLVYFGDNLKIGPNNMTFEGSELLDNSYDLFDSNTGGLWTAKFKYYKSLHSIDWKEPRLVLAPDDRRWCKKDGTELVELLKLEGKEYCNTDIRFSKNERDRFIEKLRKEEEKTWESNETAIDNTAIVQRLLDSADEGNCSLETIDDYCRKDCLKITMLNDSLECDSQLWLKGDTDQWWKVDGGRCRTKDEWTIIRNSRRHNYSQNSPVLQCSTHVPACQYDIDLAFTILLVYSGIMTVVIIALYAVLYRALDKRVAPIANEMPPSIYSCESTETKSQKTVKTKRSVKTKREEKAPMVEPLKTVFDDGNYENLTIHK